MNDIPVYKKAVVFSSDDKYAQHTGVTICSLLENTTSPESIDIYIINFGISDENKRNLEIIASQYHTRIHYIVIEQKLLKNVQVQNRNHISKAAFGKFMIPDFLSREKKAIFLDSDIIVLDDIDIMCQTDISEYLLGAVMNPFFNRYQELGLSSPSSYFNSGVLLLNLERLREFSAADKVLDFLENHKNKISGAEQDALNAVFREQWLNLHPRWNLQTAIFKNMDKAREIYENDILDEALRNPAIIHYSSSSKPWQFTNMHPLKHYYTYYLEKTPWKNYVPSDKHFKNIIKMKIKALIGYNKFKKNAQKNF